MSNVAKNIAHVRKVPLESCTSPIKISPGTVKRHSTGESEAFIYKTLKVEAMVNYASPLTRQPCEQSEAGMVAGR